MKGFRVHLRFLVQCCKHLNLESWHPKIALEWWKVEALVVSMIGAEEALVLVQEAVVEA